MKWSSQGRALPWALNTYLTLFFSKTFPFERTKVLCCVDKDCAAFCLPNNQGRKEQVNSGRMIKSSRQDSRISLFPKWRCCCSGFYLHPPLCGKCLVASTQSRQSWLICQNWGLLAPSYKSSTLLIQRKLHWWMMMVEIFCLSLAHVLILINMKKAEWMKSLCKQSAKLRIKVFATWVRNRTTAFLSKTISQQNAIFASERVCVCHKLFSHCVLRGHLQSDHRILSKRGGTCSGSHIVVGYLQQRQRRL